MGAGSFMNFVLAIIAVHGRADDPARSAVGQAVIAQVVPGSPAAEAGLKPGDIIETIDGRNIENVADASYNIRLNLGEDTDIVVARTDPSDASSQTARRSRVKPRWAPPAYVYEVKPGDDVDSVATATGFDRDYGARRPPASRPSSTAGKS